MCVYTDQVLDDFLYLGLSLLHLLRRPLQTDALLTIRKFYVNLHTRARTQTHTNESQPVKDPPLLFHCREHTQVLFYKTDDEHCYCNTLFILHAQSIFCNINGAGMWDNASLVFNWYFSTPLITPSSYSGQLLRDPSDVLSFLADDEAVQPGRGCHLHHHHALSLRSDKKFESGLKNVKAIV